MTQKEAVKRWQESAKRNLKLSHDLFEGKHFDWALFAGQLALEKLLKGLVTKKIDDAPPFTHDLIKLAKVAGINLTAQQNADLREITKFHIAARYADIKRDLYKKATRAYTTKWSAIIEELYLWLKKQ